MIYFFLWYFAISLIGLITFPLLYAVLPFLADRGYAFSRIAGLLIVSYLFWILNIFGVIPNNLSGVLICITMLFVVSYFFGRQKNWQSVWKWIKSEKRTIILIEILFLFAFAGWTIVRAANPDISGTEKPMELAFINSIIRSPSFPPNDPWLSGYAISYYYFGYVMVAFLSHLTGTLPSISFNLALSAWFAMTALGCYGVVYNLILTWLDFRNKKKGKKNKPIIESLLGPFFVLIVSNAEGFLEMLHAHGLFWQVGKDGIFQSGFWSALNIQELNQPPALPFSWIPNRSNGIWWWRASRVLQDFDTLGHSREIIDEFPFFSYLLGDLHPHVLAMPFVLFTIGLAINLFRSIITPEYSDVPIVEWLKKPFFWLIALTCGGIAFLNTWDLPVCLGLLVLTFFIMRVQKVGWEAKRLLEMIGAVILIGGIIVLLYSPFFLGFSSQAGGILPSLDFFTPGINFWVMFLPFLIPIFIFLIWVLCKQQLVIPIKSALSLPIIFTLGLGVLSYTFGWIIGNATGIVAFLQKLLGRALLSLVVVANNAENAFLSIHGGIDINSVIFTSLINRISSPITLITLFLLFVLIWIQFYRNIFQKPQSLSEIPAKTKQLNNNSVLMIFLTIFMGILLCLIPEFVYLRDVFGTRMNTIFKFYFQTWMVWGVASAAVVIILWWEIKDKFRIFSKTLISVCIVICLAYPCWGLISKTNSFKPAIWTLDGNSYIQNFNPDEYEALNWLKKCQYGVIAEAVGGSYSEFARISTTTGLPTVLGWPGHELQWRGSSNEIGSREQDIETLYTTKDWQTAKSIIDQYQIQYIYIGDLEKSKYNVDEVKFQNNMVEAFKNQSTTIYETQLP